MHDDTEQDDPTFDFDSVFAAELSAINFRRRSIREGRVSRDRHPVDAADKGAASPVASGRGTRNAPAGYLVPRGDATISAPSTPHSNARVSTASNLTGLALSGGGMRSASVCLGVLQALDALAPKGKPQVIDALDYLSTVSGGGYIGASLVSGLSEEPYTFPFESRLDSEETPEVQHLRDFSNFIAPNGAIDLVVAFATVLRGLIVNAVIVLPFLLMLAVITIRSNPTRSELGDPDILGNSLRLMSIPYISIPGFEGFTVTINLAFVVVLLLFGTAIILSHFERAQSLRRRELIGRAMAWALVAIGGVLVFEVQPFVLAGMLNAPMSPSILNTNGVDASQGGANAAIVAFFGFFGSIAPNLAAVLAPLALFLISLGQKLANVAKATMDEGKLKAILARYSSRAMLYLAGAIVPLLLWIAYIYLSYWGVFDTRPKTACHTNAPVLLHQLAGCGQWWEMNFAPSIGPIGALYFIAAIFTGVLCLLIGPNANSLHYLYRDRLSRAFLVNRQKVRQDGRGVETDADRRKFSEIKPVLPDVPVGGPYTPDSFDRRAMYAPYLLVNTAINIEASEKLNRRGRNADTFVFSPLFIGNHFTGYVPTKSVEAVEKVFGLATAMAISGAAASANMGRATIKVLTFSLALLNIRLGYWFPNPKWIDRLAKGWWRRLAQVGIWQFVLEAFGQLDERKPNVYLTDGGHVENLGVYELVRRRCRAIIAVDVDLDRSLTFPSLVGLEMMARIDLGARIEVPWQDLQKIGLGITERQLHGPNNPDYPGCHGPHAAIGIIRYDNNETGVLIHIKTMLTGDENDYILDYKRRNSTFPHETTLDQFYSEEQFEVHRALGFHAAWQLFTGAEDFGQLKDPPDDWPKQVERALKLLNIPHPMVKKIVARIKMPARPSAAAGGPQASGHTPGDTGP